jgi:phospholipid/cholesterol/gamma-HCH transport system ATP-binding protein
MRVKESEFINRMIECMSQKAQVFVECHHVGFRRNEKAIFSGLNMSIKKGQITAILGPSGTGKTTLLKLFCGQLIASTGEVLIDGQDIAELNRTDLFKLRQRMSLLFQTGALFTDMSVFENVAFALREHTKLPEHMIRDLVLLRLDSVGLRGAADLMPSQLSGGMARRVALARSLALDPELILYDEPFTGQDPISMGVLVNLIRQVHEDLKLTSVLVTHDVKEALSIADQVFILAQGKVIGSGSPEQIKQSDNPLVKQFLYGHIDGPVAFHYPAPDLAEQVLNYD